MKRSEMIKDIQDYLELINTKSDFPVEKMAEYIVLGCCEAQGMLPPAMDHYMETSYSKEEVENGSDIRFEWEDEDDD